MGNEWRRFLTTMSRRTLPKKPERHRQESVSARLAKSFVGKTVHRQIILVSRSREIGRESWGTRPNSKDSGRVVGYILFTNQRRPLTRKLIPFA